eukprot:4678883-Pyramimonas_sp.AAC.1
MPLPLPTICPAGAMSLQLASMSSSCGEGGPTPPPRTCLRATIPRRRQPRDEHRRSDIVPSQARAC